MLCVLYSGSKAAEYPPSGGRCAHERRRAGVRPKSQAPLRKTPRKGETQVAGAVNACTSTPHKTQSPLIRVRDAWAPGRLDDPGAPRAPRKVRPSRLALFAKKGECIGCLASFEGGAPRRASPVGGAPPPKRKTGGPGRPAPGAPPLATGLSVMAAAPPRVLRPRALENASPRMFITGAAQGTT